MLLFLDDVRTPKQVKWINLPSYDSDDWKIVRNFKSFCNAINDNWLKTRELPTFVSFDHDLADIDADKTEGFTEKTGLDCATWLVKFCHEKSLPLPKWGVHSLNYVGKRRIEMLLIDFEQ